VLVEVDGRLDPPQPGPQPFREADVSPLLDRLEQVGQRVEPLDHVELELGLLEEQPLRDDALELTLGRPDRGKELPLVDDAEVAALGEGVHAGRDRVQVEQRPFLDQHPVAIP
jgi:hypothetical protein